MTTQRRLSSFGLISLLMLVCVTACERSSTPSQPMNEVLGDGGQGAPIAAPRVDMGILSDQSTYKRPTAVAAAGGGGAADTAEGAEPESAEAIRSLARETVAAALEPNVPAVFAALDPTKTELLQEHQSAAIELVDKLMLAFRLINEKAGPEASSSSAANEQLLNTLRTESPAMLAQTVRVVAGDSEDAAVLTIDPEKLAEQTRSLMSLVTPALEQEFERQVQAGAITAEEAEAARAQMSPEVLTAAVSAVALPPIPVVRVDGAWKFALPRAVTAEESALVGESLGLFNRALDSLIAKLEAEAQIDQTIVQNMSLATFAEFGSEFEALTAKWLTLLSGGGARAEAGELDSAGAGEAEGDPEAEPEVESDEDNSRRRPGGG